MTARKLLLAFGALAGLGLALAPTFENLDPIGLALATLAAVTICGAILCGARAQQFVTRTQLNFYTTAITSILFAVLTSVLNAWSFPSNPIGWLGIFCAGIGIAVGLLAFFAAFRYLSPVRATMLSNVEPLLSILFAAAILGQQLQLIQWIGVAIMMGAIVLFEGANRDERRRPPGERDFQCQ